MDKKIELYVSPAWRREGLHTPLLNPWWGNPVKKESLFAKELFDSYAFDTAVYNITDNLGQAHMVLPPYRHKWMLDNDVGLFMQCVKTAKKAGLPLLIDGVGDVEYALKLPNAYALRIGGYRFMFEEGRIQVPPLADDLLERVCGGELRIRPKGKGKPIVGFAGWAHLKFSQRLRTLVKELPIRLRGIFDDRYRAMQKGVLWRERAIAVLRNSNLVDLNLKERSSFSGSAKTAQDDMRVLRREFVDTVLASDYCLDVRGDANASTRLFEILSLGRIPVIVDTERILPFSDRVDYREFSLIVDFRDVKQLPEIIARFHEGISPERFEEMQRKAREVFVQYFRIDAQMQHIVKILSKML